VFCNDRYLEIYGLARSDIPRKHNRAGTAGDAARNAVCSTSVVEDFYKHADTPEGLVTELPGGGSVSGQMFQAA